MLYRCITEVTRSIPCRVNEADEVGVEGAVDGIQDCHLAQSLHDHEQHHACNQEAQ